MRRVFAFALLCLFAATLHAAQSSEHALEQRVKAAFIYRFIEFITWPEPLPGEGAFVIGVVGSDGVAEELRRITASRAAAGRPIEVRRIAPDAPMPPLHMVFIADTERARLPQLVRAAPRGALVVTETEGALAAGAVINFVIVDGRVRFEISPESAEKRGIRLSSRLIALAQNVRGSP